MKASESADGAENTVYHGIDTQVNATTSSWQTINRAVS